MAVEVGVDVVVDSRRVRIGREPERAFLAREPPPVVDELVARDGHEPGDAEVGTLSVLHRPYRGEERLGR